MGGERRQPALDPPMSPDWNAIRLDLLGIDEPTRATLREMRPFFARVLPDILAQFYDKVRRYDPSCGIPGEDAMQDAIRMQLQHWNLIGGAEFGLAYISSLARFCELNQRAGVAPQWYIGCRLMFVADQLIKAVETEVQVPDDGTAAQAARDKKAEMVKAPVRGANREPRNDAITNAGDRLRASIAPRVSASNELERSGRAVA